MAQVRISPAFDPRQGSACDFIQIYDYTMEEVLLPASASRPSRKAIQVVVRGTNLKAVAQPLFVLVGDQALHFVRIASDERSVEGVLLAEPKAGVFVEVHLGDQDAARHPHPVDLARVKRLGPE
jgi:hypothetical protein